MKKTIVGVLLCTISMVSRSQIKYVPGYYYDNQSQKTECLIENADWKNNPAEFNYKLHESDEPKAADISSVKEFGIYNYSKYVRGTVKIDRWAETTNRYDDSKSPKWSDEVLFLKVLVDGKASLFVYHDNEITRLFYTIQDSSYDIKRSYYVFPDTSIQQLVYKRYVTKNVPAANEVFRKQLLDYVRCDKISVESVLSLNYGESDLIEYFIKYNECIGAAYIDYHAKSMSLSWHLKLVLGLNRSVLKISDNETISNATFNPLFSFRAGAEIEGVLPFGMKTWSVFIAPSYLSFNTSKDVVISTSLYSYRANATGQFRFFEFPVGIKRTFYFNEDHGFFLSAAYAFVLNNKSSFMIGQPEQRTLDIQNGGGADFGGGFFFKNLNLEVLYYTKREYLRAWDSEYQAVSFNMGYRIF